MKCSTLNSCLAQLLHLHCNQAPFDGDADYAEHIAGTCLTDHAFAMALYCLQRDVKLTGDLLAVIALEDQLEDFPFPAGERGNKR